MLNLEPPLVRSSSRLEAYSDALFSIIATVMIVPVSHTELPVDENLGTSFVRLMLPQITVYYLTFLIISSFWGDHARLYASLENVDEFMVLLNLAIMMVVTFLPFTFTLLGQFPVDGLAIVIFFGGIILKSLLLTGFVVHVFRSPGALKPELRDEETRKIFRNRMLVNIGTPVVFAVLAIIFAFISPPISLALCAVMVFSTYIRLLLAKCYTWLRSSNAPEVPSYITDRISRDVVPKDRVEFFSDGVFAIVATLIILDICESAIPDADMVEKYGGLSSALSHYAPRYLAYAGTFCIVALQWYVHHSLLHYIKELNRLMLFLNQFCLLWIGLTPLAFQLTTNFDIHDYKNNETFALQLNCIVIFSSSMLQAAIWVVALFNQEKYLVATGHHHGDDHGYMTAKLCILPLLTLLVFWLTVLLQSLSVTAFVSMQFGAIGLFILLGLLFTHIRRIFTGRSERLLIEVNEENPDHQREENQDLQPVEIN